MWMVTTLPCLKKMIEKNDCDKDITKLTSSRAELNAYLLGFINIEHVKNYQKYRIRGKILQYIVKLLIKNIFY